MCDKTQKAVVELAKTRTTASQIPFSTSFQGSINEIPDAISLAIYRIVQEATVNIIKYSKAASASISITIVDDAIVLTVSDDGIGFYPKERSEGIGLISMRERVLAIGGSMTVITEPNAGVELVFEIYK